MGTWIDSIRFGRENRRILGQLSRVVGPAPWYWTTFPAVTSKGRELVWRRNEKANGRKHSVVLHEAGKPETVLLAVDMYSRVFSLPPNMLGIWFEEGQRIRAFAVNPDSLVDFQLSEPLPPSVSDHGGFTCSGGPLVGITVTMNQGAGEYWIELPMEFAGLTHQMMVGSYERIREASGTAIYEIQKGPAAGSCRLKVLPLKWFTGDTFDLGYQWITRTARDAKTGKIIGDGIRVTPFILKEDDSTFDRWITQDPRLPIGYRWMADSF